MSGKSHTKITGESLSRVLIKVPVGGNTYLEEVVKKINSNLEIKTLWKVINVNAIDRLGLTDHGPTHFNIVANYGLQIARIFEKRGGKVFIVREFGFI